MVYGVDVLKIAFLLFETVALAKSAWIEMYERVSVLRLNKLHLCWAYGLKFFSVREVFSVFMVVFIY